MQTSFYDFTEYNPQRTAETLPLIKAGLVFIKDKSGNDWRKLSAQLAKNKSYAHYIVVDKYNAVASYSTDPTLLFPVNCSVHVVEDVPVEKFADSYFEWAYVNDQFVRHTELQRVLADKFMREAQDWVAEELDTEENEERIVLLRKFRTALTDLDMSAAPHIDWPVRP